MNFQVLNNALVAGMCFAGGIRRKKDKFDVLESAFFRVCRTIVYDHGDSALSVLEISVELRNPVGEDLGVIQAFLFDVY